MKRYAIIVAGGAGKRMGTSLPKQFLEVKGKPILMHTLEKFQEAGNVNIVVVLPEGQLALWQKLCSKHYFNIIHELVGGGETRFRSVKNGLNHISANEGVVAVHDGVRPCVSPRLINQCFEEAAYYGSAVASVSLKDSIRMVQNNDSKAMPREQFRLMQTPQAFVLHKIKEAYNTKEHPDFTDDASVFEAAGFKVHLTGGEAENIKITTPEDLKMAEFLLSQ